MVMVYFKFFLLKNKMDPDSNFIFERCKEVAKLSQEILEKIRSKVIDKDQDI
jgi:hypothetical protein